MSEDLRRVSDSRLLSIIRERVRVLRFKTKTMDKEYARELLKFVKRASRENLERTFKSLHPFGYELNVEEMEESQSVPEEVLELDE